MVSMLGFAGEAAEVARKSTKTWHALRYLCRVLTAKCASSLRRCVPKLREHTPHNITNIMIIIINNIIINIIIIIINTTIFNKVITNIISNNYIISNITIIITNK